MEHCWCQVPLSWPSGSLRELSLRSPCHTRLGAYHPPALGIAGAKQRLHEPFTSDERLNAIIGDEKWWNIHVLLVESSWIKLKQIKRKSQVELAKSPSFWSFNFPNLWVPAPNASCRRQATPRAVWPTSCRALTTPRWPSLGTPCWSAAVGVRTLPQDSWTMGLCASSVWDRIPTNMYIYI